MTHTLRVLMNEHAPNTTHAPNMGTGMHQGGGAAAPPDFGRSVNSISTRGADYAHHSTTCPPGFLTLAASL